MIGRARVVHVDAKNGVIFQLPSSSSSSSGSSNFGFASVSICFCCRSSPFPPLSFGRCVVTPANQILFLFFLCLFLNFFFSFPSPLPLLFMCLPPAPSAMLLFDISLSDAASSYPRRFSNETNSVFFSWERVEMSCCWRKVCLFFLLLFLCCCFLRRLFFFFYLYSYTLCFNISFDFVVVKFDFSFPSSLF